ncbi:MAG: tetratricopeptide repeat protein [Pseudomonadota bacterium]
MRRALRAAAFILVLSALRLPGVAGAAVLTGLHCQSGPEATDILFDIDGETSCAVRREGASGLLVRLGGVQAGSGVATAGLSDNRVAAVELKPGAEALLVRVNTRLASLGYVQSAMPGGLRLRLFSDAPGGESPSRKTPLKDLRKKPPKVARAEARQETSKAGGQGVANPTARVKASARTKAEDRRANTPTDNDQKRPLVAEKSPKEAAPVEKDTRMKGLPGFALYEPSTESVGAGNLGVPASVLAAYDHSPAAARELPELPSGTPDFGGLLPGTTRTPQDALLARLLPSRESESAYRAAVVKLRGDSTGEALRAFREMQAAYPKTIAAARAAFRVADCLYQLVKSRRDRDEALQAYVSAVAKWPLQDEVGRAYLQIGRLYAEGGYDYEALGYLGLATREQPDGRHALRAYLLRGDIYYRRGQYKKAQGEFARVGRFFPNSAMVREANFKLVRTLFAQKDFAGVERAYQEMRTRWPETFGTDPQLLSYIGETYFQKGDYHHARQFLFYVLNIYPDMTANHLILCRIADAYLAEGRDREASKLYRLVRGAFPNSEGACLARMRLAENGLAEGRALRDGLASGEKRLGDFKLYESLAAGRGSIAQQAKVRIGLWYYWRHDYLRAAEYLQGLLAREAGLPAGLKDDCRYGVSEALFHQLKAYFEQGRYAEAVRFTEKWDKWLTGERAEAFYYAGESHRLLHLPEEAARLFAKTERMPWREDLRRETLLGLGLARLETGDYADAARVLRQLVECYPTYSRRLDALRALGRADYLLGKYEPAAQALGQALSSEASSAKRAEDLYLFGLVLGRMKEHARAADALRQSLSAGAAYGCGKGLQAAAMLELGNALLAQGRQEEAVKAYLRVRALAPGSGEAQQALYKAGKCYLSLGRRNDAASVFGQGAAGSGTGVWQKASARMMEGLELDRMVP